MVLFAQVRLRGSLTTGIGDADVVTAAARAATIIDTRIITSMSAKRYLKGSKAENSFWRTGPTWNFATRECHLNTGLRASLARMPGHLKIDIEGV